MNVERIIDAIHALNKVELAQFKKSLKQINVLNKSDAAVLLLKIIPCQVNNYAIWSKEKIHEIIYPNQMYNDLKIRHLLCKANVLLQDYILQQKIKEEEYLKNNLISEFYLENGKIQHAEKLLNRNKDSLNSKVATSINYLKHYEIESKVYDILLKNSRKTDAHLLKMSDNLSIYLLIESLKTACYLYSNNLIIDEKKDFPLIQPLLKIALLRHFQKIPQIFIYSHLFKLLIKWSPIKYKSILPSIKKHENKFLADELYNIYKLLINFCIKESNKNNLEFTKLAFEIYLYAIDKGYLLSYGQLNRYSLSNVVAIGLKLNEIAESEAFLNRNYKKVSSKYIDITYRYNISKILYAKDEKHKALKILLSTEFKDALWYLNAKFITLKILLDIEDMDRYNQYLKSFKMYIHRKENIGYHKQYFSKVADAFSILLKIKRNPNKFSKYKFDSATPEYNWFTNKKKELCKIY